MCELFRLSDSRNKQGITARCEIAKRLRTAALAQEDEREYKELAAGQSFLTDATAQCVKAIMQVFLFHPPVRRCFAARRAHFIFLVAHARTLLIFCSSRAGYRAVPPSASFFSAAAYLESCCTRCASATSSAAYTAFTRTRGGRRRGKRETFFLLLLFIFFLFSQTGMSEFSLAYRVLVSMVRWWL